MPNERELWLRWDEPDMYLEIYKENLFIEECKEKKAKMFCVWSADKSVYPLDFILTVKENTVICDFEKLDYSHDIEVEIGIMKIEFTDNYRDMIFRVYWKDKGEPNFRVRSSKTKWVDVT